LDDRVLWRTSSRSGNAECVEVAVTAQSVLVRDSKSRDGSVLRFTHEGWAVFVASLRTGTLEPK
jgi:hypothetical protein